MLDYCIRYADINSSNLGGRGESHWGSTPITAVRARPFELRLQSLGVVPRSRALIRGMLADSEDRIDDALGSFLPRYARLAEQTDFTFSMKIALCEALA